MKISVKLASIVAILAISMCSVAPAGFIRFKRPSNGGNGNSGGGKSSAPDPVLANTIWTGIGTLTIDKVYFKNAKDQQRTAIVSPTLNVRMEIWFRTERTFTVLVDTTYLDYAPEHRVYEPLLGDQLDLNYVRGPFQSYGYVHGPLYGYRSTGTLDPTKHTFVGDHDAQSPPDDPNDLPECTTKVSGSYYFTGTGEDRTLVPSVTAVQVPFNTEGVVFNNATCTGVFTKVTSRTVASEVDKHKEWEWKHKEWTLPDSASMPVF